MSQVFDHNAYLPVMARITEIREMTEREKYFKLELSQPLYHHPGQFVMVSVIGIGEAPISISCGPTAEPVLEMIIRKTGRLTKVIHNMKVGDALGIRGPYGSGFNLDDFYGKDVLFVAGGLGLAPLRSLIDPVMANRERFGKITLISGCRTPAEELYRDKTTAWQKVEGVEVIRLVDATANLRWDGEVGLVTAPIPQLDLQPETTVAALCGPPVMYKFVIMALDAKGIPHSQIFVDLERRMKCGVGKCGHCQINASYCCQDGPVFRYSETMELQEALT
ncbi:MAG: oxidoreductase [Acidobacteria bacterium]|nr:MAG: oxidoreductase [Acidobacteriota bacterium]